MGSGNADFVGDKRFEVVRVLGRGGMGAVYEVHDRERDERVALKLLLRTDAAGVDRFRREFRTLKSLDHPSLVKLYELFSADGQWFFTMELLYGRDLTAHVRGAAPSAPASTLPPASRRPSMASAAFPSSSSPEAWGDGGAELAEQTTLADERRPPSAPPPLAAPLTLPPTLPPPAAMPPTLPPSPSAPSPPLSLATLPPPPTPPPGPDLAREPPDYDRLRRAFSSLAGGLCYLHERDKLHRDLKPSNVLVTREGRVILLDFGLVTDLLPGALDRSSMHALVGTPLYMAPEYAAGRLLTMASDWYCVGLMLYQALTGLVPHEEYARNALELMVVRQQIDPRPPRELVPSVPADLDALCVGLLRRSPEARPSGPEVLAALAGASALAAPRPAAAAGRAESPSFVGREAELAALGEAARLAGEGRAVVVDVVGESGVGKSRLVQHFLEGVAGGGRHIVLTSRCSEGESVPYKAAVGLMDHLRRHLQRLARGEAEGPSAEQLLPRDVWALARLFPALQRVHAVAGAPRRDAGGAEPRELRRRAFAAARELFARMADRALVVLHVDDLQWGDRDSGELFAELLRGPNAPPLLVVLTCRREDQGRSAFLRALRSEAGAPSGGALRFAIEVGPLPPADAEALAGRLLRDGGDPAVARQIAAESGGSPIFLQQLARDADAPPEGKARGAGRPGDLTLERVLRKRVLGLPDEARRLLELVAVARHPVSERVAGYAAEAGGGARASLDRLHAEHLVRACAEGRGLIEAYHDRIREIVLARIDEGERRAYHERLALALESTTQADPEVVATHFRAAGRPALAGRHALAAARLAERALAFDRAVRLYRFALECQPDEAAARPLRVKLGDALANAGRGPEAAEAYLAALPGAEPAEGHALRTRAAEQYFSSGRMDQGYAVVRSLLETLGLGLPQTPQGVLLKIVALHARQRLRGTAFRRRAEAEVPPEALLRVDTCWTLSMSIGNVDPVRGAYFQALNLRLALDAGEPYRVGRALSVEAPYALSLGKRSRAEAADFIARARQIAEELDNTYLLGLTFLHEAIAAFLVEEQWQKAWELCQRSDAALRQHGTGVAYERTVVQFYSLNSLMVRGEIAALVAELDGALERALDRHDLFAECFVKFRFRPMAHFAADRPERVHDDVATLRDRLSTRDLNYLHYWRIFAEVQALLYSPHRPAAAEALARLDGEWAKVAMFLRTRFHRVDAFYLRARAALAVAERGERDPRPLLQRAAADADAIEKAATPRAAPLARLIRAGIAALEGRSGAAAELLYDAADGLDRVGMRLHAEAARRRRGTLRGGPRGLALVAAADAWMRGQGVQDPERMSALHAPGFRP